MSELPPDMAGIYRTMDELSLQHAPHLGVPREVRMFGVEISAEVACLSDEDVMSLARQLDTAAQERGGEDEPLSSIFDRHRSRPPATFADDPEKATAWALKELRIGAVSRRFRAEYAQRFPERVFTGYERSEEFLQGSVIAFRTMEQFLSRSA